MVTVTIPSTAPDVGELLSNQYAAQKQNNRQELALRGDNEDQDGNLKQIVCMKAYSDTLLKDWLVKKDNVYTRAEIQNEIIQTMSLQVLREIMAELQSSPFLTIMIDESTDSSNMEQVTCVVRLITEELEVHEEFLGVYAVDSTDATTLVSLIKNVMIRMNLPMAKLQRQCYDGASVMSWIRSGVAKKIADIELRAIYTHCYGHAIYLAVGDTEKQSKIMRNALETTYEIIKLTKYSPMREAMFKNIKANLFYAPTVRIRTLCPTRWTVRAISLASIISNYKFLQITKEKAVKVSKDTEIKARNHGVSAQMITFDYLYGVILVYTPNNYIVNFISTYPCKETNINTVNNCNINTVNIHSKIAILTNNGKKSKKNRSSMKIEKQRSKRRKHRFWNDESMISAIKAVKNGVLQGAAYIARHPNAAVDGISLSKRYPRVWETLLPAGFRTIKLIFRDVPSLEDNRKSCIATIKEVQKETTEAEWNYC
ncbi:zinc finger MYM-type protein 1-like [Hydra vulgaris]|uniref:Zinc finger MYM-type protein 1-like n=1 Tax=Hydra vulgaris TaxID=6087 RepID=A0ABM4B2P8_HYDVU